MHWEALEWVAKTKAALDEPEPRSVLEIGAWNINGSARTAFPDTTDWIGVDLQGGQGVDIVCDASNPVLLERVGDRRFDAVVCMEVLEHAPDCPGIIRNAFRLLKPTGRLWITCAGPDRTPHSCAGFDNILPEGEHYDNVSQMDLLSWLMQEGFRDGVIEYGRGQQDVYATFRRNPQAEKLTQAKVYRKGARATTRR